MLREDSNDGIVETINEIIVEGNLERCNSRKKWMDIIKEGTRACVVNEVMVSCKV